MLLLKEQFRCSARAPFMAKEYHVPVILHTDHAAKKAFTMIDGLLDAGEAYYKSHEQPLFSTHMLDLSEESLEENIGNFVEYLKGWTLSRWESR